MTFEGPSHDINLTSLSDREVAEAYAHQIKFMGHLDHGPLAYTYKELSRFFPVKCIQDQTVYDIGSGSTMPFMAKLMINLGAAKYKAADPVQFPFNDPRIIEAGVRTGRFTPDEAAKMSVCDLDGLCFLLEQESHSGIIIASSLFDEPIGGGRSAYPALEDEYLKRIIQQMFRVTNGAVFGYGMSSDALRRAMNTGFEAYVNEDEGFYVLRRPSAPVEVSQNEMVRHNLSLLFQDDF